MRTARLHAIGLIAVAMMLAGPTMAGFSSVDSRFVQCDVSTGYPGSFGIGLLGIAQIPGGAVRVANCCEGGWFGFTPSAFPTCTDAGNTRLSGNSDQGLVVGMDGHLYASRNFADAVEVDPSTGAVVRILMTGRAAIGITVDPATGDIFTTAGNQVWRISNPYSGTPVVSLFATSSVGQFDGCAWSCDGSMLVVASDSVDKVQAFDRSGNERTLATIASGSGPDGIAFGKPGTPLAGNVYTNNNNGSVTEIPISNPTAFVTIASGSGRRGDHLTVDAQGSLLLNAQDRVIRLTANNGSFMLSTSSDLCANLHCAAEAAAGCTGDAKVANAIREHVANVCVRTNDVGKGGNESEQLCSLISFVKKQAPNCTGVLVAAQALQQSLGITCK